MEAEKAIKEAESWLESAKELLQKSSNLERYTVVAAESIHAIMRTNDALTMKYLRTRARRHDEATVLFKELIRQKKIPQEESRFADILTKAINNKSAYDYGGKWASKADANYWLLYAEKFLSMAKKHVV